jgi:sarcosine oxidase, subunit gamma
MRRSVLWLEQAAPNRRFGIKGPRAAELLQQQGLVVPDRPNTWAPLRAQDRDDSPNVIARLGNTEFFLEEQGDAPGIAALAAVTVAGLAGVYPVLREDFAAVLGGKRATEVLTEVCNVDFAAQVSARRPVVMTLMAGVAVVVLSQPADTGPEYRIWCDPSFGPYLWETLASVVRTITGSAA